MKISLDTETMVERYYGEFSINSNSEEALANLLAIRDKINAVIEDAKAKIKQEILSSNGVKPNSYTGEYIKVELRKYGGSYAIEQPEKVDQAFLTVKETLNTKAVKEFEEETGMLPDGIEKIEREPQITLKIKEV